MKCYLKLVNKIIVKNVELKKPVIKNPASDRREQD